MFCKCPFFLNGFVISGEKNLMLFFTGEDLASLESIIDERLRPDDDVQSADFNIVISSIKDFVMPIQIRKFWKIVKHEIFWCTNPESRNMLLTNIMRVTLKPVGAI